MTPAYAQESSELAPPSSLGRVTYVSLNIRQAPTTQSAQVRQLLRDCVQRHRRFLHSHRRPHCHLQMADGAHDRRHRR